MNDPTEKLNQLLFLFTQLPDAVLQSVSTLGQIKQRLEQLEGRTCTGHVHWRDKDTPGKTAKLYILHGTDEPCPLHGQPDPGKRLRTYIGNKPERIARAKGALDLYGERRQKLQELLRLHSILDRILYVARYMFTTLHLPIPTPNGYNLTPVTKKDPVAT